MDNRKERNVIFGTEHQHMKVNKREFELNGNATLI